MSFTLNPLFSDHMVLAANKPIRVFGQGDASVTVSLAGMEAASSPMTLRDGTSGWIAVLPALPAGGPFILTVTDGEQTVTLSDVMVGVVYLLAGQSNIQFKVCESSADPSTYADNPDLRLFTLDRIEDSDRWHAKDGWIPCRREEVPVWSAIGWHLGMMMTERLNCAVGLIACYQGASVIESWMPEVLCSDPAFKIADADKFLDHFYELYVGWNGDAMLYHAMFEKLIPYAMSAVIWYQGESDCSDAEASVYDKELTAMIGAWREDLMDGELAFVIIQIADFVGRDFPAWHAVQAAQTRVGESVPHTVCVVSADVCEDNEIHPKTKIRLAARIADALERGI